MYTSPALSTARNGNVEDSETFSKGKNADNSHWTALSAVVASLSDHPTQSTTDLPQNSSLNLTKINTGDLEVSEPSGRAPRVLEPPPWLPLGWKAVEKTRLAGKSAGTKDKYYIEDITGRQFRSRTEVSAYLEWKKTTSPESTFSKKAFVTSLAKSPKPPLTKSPNIATPGAPEPLEKDKAVPSTVSSTGQEKPAVEDRSCQVSSAQLDTPDASTNGAPLPSSGVPKNLEERYGVPLPLKKRPKAHIEPTTVFQKAEVSGSLSSPPQNPEPPRLPEPSDAPEPLAVDPSKKRPSASPKEEAKEEEDEESRKRAKPGEGSPAQVDKTEQKRTEVIRPASLCQLATITTSQNGTPRSEHELEKRANNVHTSSPHIPSKMEKLLEAIEMDVEQGGTSGASASGAPAGGCRVPPTAPQPPATAVRQVAGLSQQGPPPVHPKLLELRGGASRGGGGGMLDILRALTAPGAPGAPRARLAGGLESRGTTPLPFPSAPSAAAAASRGVSGPASPPVPFRGTSVPWTEAEARRLWEQRMKALEDFQIQQQQLLQQQRLLQQKQMNQMQQLQQMQPHGGGGGGSAYGTLNGAHQMAAVGFGQQRASDAGFRDQNQYFATQQQQAMAGPSSPAPILPKPRNGNSFVLTGVSQLSPGGHFVGKVDASGQFVRNEKLSGMTHQNLKSQVRSGEDGVAEWIKQLEVLGKKLCEDAVAIMEVQRMRGM